MKRAAALAMILLVLAPIAARASSNASQPAKGTDYSATAVADGTRVSYTVPGFAVVEQVVDSGAPTAQASLDSLGNANGFAATPNPGDLTLSLPSTATGAAGLPPAPAYPLMVRSSADHPKAAFSAGAYDLSAESTPTSVTAGALFGAPDQTTDSGSRSTASVQLADDGQSVKAEATSSNNGLRVGPLVIVGAQSKATAVAAVGRELTRSSSLTVQAMNAFDVPIGVDSKGLTVAGRGVALSIDALLKGLAEQGITLRYVAPVETPDGITSAGLEITIHETPAVAGAPENIVTIIVGSASAHSRISGGGPSVSSQDANLAASASPGSTPPGLTPMAIVESANKAPSNPGNERFSDRRTAYAPVPGLDVWSIYLAIVIGAATLFCVNQLVRLLAVRLLWK